MDAALTRTVAEKDAEWLKRLVAAGFHPGLSPEENVAEIRARAGEAERDAFDALMVDHRNQAHDLAQAERQRADVDAEIVKHKDDRSYWATRCHDNVLEANALRDERDILRAQLAEAERQRDETRKERDDVMEKGRILRDDLQQQVFAQAQVLVELQAQLAEAERQRDAAVDAFDALMVDHRNQAHDLAKAEQRGQELRESLQDALQDFDTTLADIAQALGLIEQIEADGIRRAPGHPEILSAISAAEQRGRGLEGALRRIKLECRGHAESIAEASLRPGP